MRFGGLRARAGGAGRPCPALYYLAGLTCTEETFPTKARRAADGGGAGPDAGGAGHQPARRGHPGRGASLGLRHRGGLLPGRHPGAPGGALPHGHVRHAASCRPRWRDTSASRRPRAASSATRWVATARSSWRCAIPASTAASRPSRPVVAPVRGPLGPEGLRAATWAPDRAGLAAYDACELVRTRAAASRAAGRHGHAGTSSSTSSSSPSCSRPPAQAAGQPLTLRRAGRATTTATTSSPPSWTTTSRTTRGRWMGQPVLSAADRAAYPATSSIKSGRRAVVGLGHELPSSRAPHPAGIRSGRSARFGDRRDERREARAAPSPVLGESSVWLKTRPFERRGPRAPPRPYMCTPQPRAGVAQDQRGRDRAPPACRRSLVTAHLVRRDHRHQREERALRLPALRATAYVVVRTLGGDGHLHRIAGTEAAKDAAREVLRAGPQPPIHRRVNAESRPCRPPPLLARLSDSSVDPGLERGEPGNWVTSGNGHSVVATGARPEAGAPSQASWTRPSAASSHSNPTQPIEVR